MQKYGAGERQKDCQEREKGKIRAVHAVPEHHEEQNDGNGTEEKGTDVKPQGQAGAGVGGAAGNTELAFRNHGVMTVSSWYRCGSISDATKGQWLVASGW